MSDIIVEAKSMRQIGWELEPGQKARTIGQHQEVVRKIWGRQNRVSSSPREMLETMLIWYGTLSECARKAPRAACTTEFALLNFTTTLFCLANQMDVDLGEAIALKYPGACFYCNKVTNCICSGESAQRGPKHFLREADPSIVGLSLGECQLMLNNTYGAGNAIRGVDFVMRRLVEELAELLKAVRSKRISPINEEIADVFAWSSGLVTLLEFDLAKLLINPLRRPHLEDACHHCTLVPCIQTPFCPEF